MDILVAWHEYFVQLKCLVSCVTDEIERSGKMVVSDVLSTLLHFSFAVIMKKG
jgi:hypothetical protein